VSEQQAEYQYCTNSITLRVTLSLTYKNVQNINGKTMHRSVLVFVSAVGLQTPCEIAANEATTGALIGAYTPQCDEQGHYNAEQVDSSSGYHWCVNQHGRMINGTQTQPGILGIECSRYKGYNDDDYDNDCAKC